MNNSVLGCEAWSLPMRVQVCLWCHDDSFRLRCQGRGPNACLAVIIPQPKQKTSYASCRYISCASRLKEGIMCFENSDWSVESSRTT